MKASARFFESKAPTSEFDPDYFNGPGDFTLKLALGSEAEIQFAMSMLDSFFNKGFRGAKCKTLLKLTIPRIKLLRNRREIQLKQMRKDIAKLLENGQEATARIRVEHIVREENTMAAQEILELFCELIAVRLPIIETQRECPMDLKEAISTICFAAPRCADLPELIQVQMLFSAKYGKEFVTAATELLPDCGVNRQVIELLSIRAPSVETKLKLLKEIAEEHELEWDPTATESEFLKPHDDLLNGASHFTNGISVPLPPPKHVTPSPEPLDESHAESDSDADDSLDLPEVPKDLIRAASGIPSSRNLSNVQCSTDDLGHDANDITKPVTHEMPCITSVEPIVDLADDSLDLPEVPKDFIRVASGIPSSRNLSNLPSSTDDLGHDANDITKPVTHDMPCITSVEPKVDLASSENKQFVPFVNLPSFSSVSVSEKKKELDPFVSPISDNLKTNQPTVSPLSSVSVPPNQPEPAVSPTPISSFTVHGDQNESASSHPYSSSVASSAKQTSPFSLPLNQNEFAPSFSKPKSDITEDLQDLVTATRSAAETAERAAKAARAAADLAQIKIADLTTKRSNNDAESYDHGRGSEHPTNLPNQTFVQQGSFGSNESTPTYGQESRFDSPTRTPHELLFTSHVPQRSTTREDDLYFAYPNLFTSKDSDLKSGSS